MQMYANDSTLHTGISHPRASLPDVLDLIKSKKFQPEKITTLLANWDDADKAFLERTTKVIVHRSSIFANTNDLKSSSKPVNVLEVDDTDGKSNH